MKIDREINFQSWILFVLIFHSCYNFAIVDCFLKQGLNFKIQGMFLYERLVCDTRVGFQNTRVSFLKLALFKIRGLNFVLIWAGLSSRIGYRSSALQGLMQEKIYRSNCPELNQKKLQFIKQGFVFSTWGMQSIYNILWQALPAPLMRQLATDHPTCWGNQITTQVWCSLKSIHP